MKAFCERYQRIREEIEGDVLFSHMFRKPLMKQESLREAVSKLDDECRPVVVSESQKTQFQGLLLSLKISGVTINEMIGKKVSETDIAIKQILDDHKLDYVQYITVLDVPVVFLGFCFKKRPKMCWSMSVFCVVYERSVTTDNDCVRQYMLQQMGIHQFRISKSCSVESLKRFLREISSDTYLCEGRIRREIEYCPDLLWKFWKKYRDLHIAYLKTEREETEYVEQNHLPVILDPSESVTVDNEMIRDLEKMIS